jgi:SSS family solute:Na+ symporter
MVGRAAIQVAVFVARTLAVALATGWTCRRAFHAKDPAKESFLAGGGLTWPFIAGSLLLTNISCERLVGMNGAQTPLVAWWEFGAAAGLLVLAHVLVPMYDRYHCTTLLVRSRGAAVVAWG